MNGEPVSSIRLTAMRMAILVVLPFVTWSRMGSLLLLKDKLVHLTFAITTFHPCALKSLHFPPPPQGIHGWDHQQRQDGRGDHAPDHRSGNTFHDVGAGAHSPHNWQQTSDDR